MNRLDTTIDVLAVDSARALVVAEDPLVRAGLAMRLGLQSAGEPQPTEDLAEAVLRVGANVVLWDLGPAGDAERDVTAAVSRLPVPIVALAPTSVRRRDLLGAGVAGVVGRETPAAALGSALGSVLHGLRVSDGALADELDVEAAPDRTPPLPGRDHDHLTAREQEVVQLMAEGLSNKQIGDRLGISAHTAKFHVNAVLGKLDASTRTEAVVRALQRGFVML